MKFTRSTSAMAVLFAISVLAACGGGGGGTTVTPPGGGGGGGPTPTPTVAPTNSPSAAPTQSPTQAPTHSPTPAPTQPPTPTPPPPTPTPRPTATHSPTPAPSATPSKTTLGAGHGQINGNDTMFTGGVSARGEVSDGDYPAGGHGPLNSTIGPNNVPCLAGMYTGGVAKAGDGYHVHVFIGMYFNGALIALPDGIGFADPEGDGTFAGIDNWTQYATNCYYETHSHDASGMIHIESFPPAPPGLYAGQFGTKYTLGDVLAVWGISYGPNNWGPLNGNVMIYTSGPTPRGGPGTTGRVNSNTYTLLCNACDPAIVNAVPLYSHEVIWVLIGTGNKTGSSLPNIQFDTEW